MSSMPTSRKSKTTRRRADDPRRGVHTSVRAVSMPVRYRVGALAKCGVVLGVAILASGPAMSANLAPNDLAALSSLDQTLVLETDAADALRTKDLAKLKRLSADIKRTYAAEISAAASIERLRNAAKPADVGPCQMAGLTLRRAIIGYADGALKPLIRPDRIDAMPPNLTDQFSAQMQRCELLERAPASTRKIGGTCLIDGRKCRESER